MCDLRGGIKEFYDFKYAFEAAIWYEMIIIDNKDSQFYLLMISKRISAIDYWFLSKWAIHEAFTW